MITLFRFFFKTLAVLLVLFPAALLGHSNFVIDEKKLKKYAPWISHEKMSEVQSAAKISLKSSLGTDENLLSRLKIEKVYTSPYYQVDIEGSQYIIDASARFWIKADDVSNIFIFNEAVTAVNVSNRTRDLFLSFIGFLESAKELVTTYNDKGGRTIYALMDLNCSHCREFHLTLRESLERQGYRIVYIPVTPEPNRKSMRINYAVFCGENEVKKQKISRVFLNGARNEIPNIEQDCNELEKLFINFSANLFGKYNLKGTPLFITDSGHFIYGNSAISEWVKRGARSSD